MDHGSYNCLVVLGATATGKTALACRLAGHLRGEIISADSRQVYRGLDLGTGKDLNEYTLHQQKIPYHLINVADPASQFYLHDFTAALLEAFTQISQRGNLPIICGGTGLYLDALRTSYELTAVPENHELRERLAGLTSEELLEQLDTFPVELTAHVDRHSQKRLIRGIETALYRKTNPLLKTAPLPYRPFYIGINSTAQQRSERIRQRLDERINMGLTDEVKNLLEQGLGAERLENLGLEYKFVTWYLQGKFSFDEMRGQLATAIIQYSKRQMTWFRRMEKQGVNIHWFDFPIDENQVMNLVKHHI